MMLWRLIFEWRARLRVWQAVAADADSGQAWLASIRVRILRFLVNRYSERSRYEELSWPVRPLLSREGPPSLSFCIVAEADGPPPRSSEEMGRILADIRACNRRRVRRPWFVWG